MPVRCPILLLGLLVGVVGCGRSGSSSTDPTDKDIVGHIAQVVKDFTEQKKRPPANLKELRQMEATHPLGVAVLAGGHYVLVWKAAISPDGGNNVLAYPKDAATKGGTVLMQDGSIKTMTAAEFSAAPKAKS